MQVGLHKLRGQISKGSKKQTLKNDQDWTNNPEKQVCDWHYSNSYIFSISTYNI
jgi:hypothetical protein